MLKRFASFEFDAANQSIRRGEDQIQLTPKSFAVLHYLIENPGRIVTKEELLKAVWPDTFVQEAVLKACILDIRKALDDSPKNPKYIVTVHRRGYRFIESASDMPSLAAPTLLLGRDADLKRLHSLLERARDGERQVAFVTGEPGIGKTTLIDFFVSQAAVRTLRGQCIEHFGAHEAYYPVLDALARAAKDGSIPGLTDALRKYAPTWLAEMPSLASGMDREALKMETLGATRDRMVREVTEAIETLAAREILIIVLEDLHWSDLSTLDLISRIAHRTENARLLLLGSYRPVEVILSNHPVRSLKRDLLARGRCVELDLELLTKAQVRTMLETRFPGHAFPREFAELAHKRTEGNPLFVVNVLDYAVSRSFIVGEGSTWRLSAALRNFDLGVPESLSQVIARQVEQLTTEERAILESASVAGVRFPISLITDRAEETASVETLCDGLTQRKLFVHSAGMAVVGSGPATAHYQFTHALYRDIFYKRLSPGRRARLHCMLAERIESLFKDRPKDAALELALHFEEGQCAEKAIGYLRMLAERCAKRHALSESVEALTRAIGLAGGLPEPSRQLTEIELTEQLGQVYRLMGQLASSSAEFEKMFELAVLIGSRQCQLRAQLWLASVRSWLDRDGCLNAVDMAVRLCETGVDADSRVSAMAGAAYWNLLFRGWSESDARASAAGIEAARRSGDRIALALHANRHAFFQSLSSRYREASATAEEGVRIAIEVDSLLDYSVGYFFEASALLFLGEWGRLQDLLRSAMAVVKRNGHEIWVVLFGLLEVYLHIEAFSFDAARMACAEYLEQSRTLGHRLSQQMSLALLGRAELGAGNPDAARKRFHELREWQSRERILMDWIWRMPLQLGIAELSLAGEDIELSRRESELLLEITSATAERTFTALAHHACARAAIARHDDDAAQRHIADGLSCIEGYEAPLAAWRLHALAGAHFGDVAHTAHARKVIRRLADSLDSDDPLRESFLRSNGVAAILNPTPTDIARANKSGR